MKELKNLKELVETIHNLYSSYEDIGLLIEMGYEERRSGDGKRTGGRNSYI